MGLEAMSSESSRLGLRRAHRMWHPGAAVVAPVAAAAADAAVGGAVGAQSAASVSVLVVPHRRLQIPSRPLREVLP